MVLAGSFLMVLGIIAVVIGLAWLANRKPELFVAVISIVTFALIWAVCYQALAQVGR